MSIILDFDHPSLGVSAFLDFNTVPGEKVRPRDRKFYNIDHEDPAIKVETEGGYVFTRPRFRRYPLRRTFTFGYTDISHNQRKQLETFWNSTQGGSFAFTWIDYDALWGDNPARNGQVATTQEANEYRRIVRFAQPFKIKTRNMGPVTRYDIESIVLKEV